MTTTDRRAKERAWARTRRFDAQHVNHEIGTRNRTGADGQQYRYCITCSEDTDPAAIRRAIEGDPPRRLNAAERRAAIVQLRQEFSAARIAEQLRVADRTVWRDLAAIRTGAAV